MKFQRSQVDRLETTTGAALTYPDWYPAEGAKLRTGWKDLETEPTFGHGLIAGDWSVNLRIN
jgi:hypothetical protein